MIDTDKYKGHTKGGWGIEPNGWQVYAYVGYDICSVGGSPNRRVDAQLIADAPLLLAEVKRLSERLKEANDDEWHRREWVENYLMSKGMSCADVAQGLENFENYRSE
jgi:hypothetical protein